MQNVIRYNDQKRLTQDYRFLDVEMREEMCFQRITSKTFMYR